MTQISLGFEALSVSTTPQVSVEYANLELANALNVCKACYFEGMGISSQLEMLTAVSTEFNTHGVSAPISRVFDLNNVSVEGLGRAIGLATTKFISWVKMLIEKLGYLIGKITNPATQLDSAFTAFKKWAAQPGNGEKTLTVFYDKSITTDLTTYPDSPKYTSNMSYEDVQSITDEYTIKMTAIAEQLLEVGEPEQREFKASDSALHTYIADVIKYLKSLRVYLHKMKMAMYSNMTAIASIATRTGDVTVSAARQGYVQGMRVGIEMAQAGAKPLYSLTKQLRDMMKSK